MEGEGPGGDGRLLVGRGGVFERGEEESFLFLRGGEGLGADRRSGEGLGRRGIDPQQRDDDPRGGQRQGEPAAGQPGEEGGGLPFWLPRQRGFRGASRGARSGAAIPGAGIRESWKDQVSCSSP
jgi:hypothetical protein